MNFCIHCGHSLEVGITGVSGFWPFKTGKTEIWYMKPGVSRDLGMGWDFLQKHDPSNKNIPNPKSLKKTHVLLGKVHETNPHTLFTMFQGEKWSPKGEARDLIKSKGLQHTSMSVGDVVVIRGKAFMVDNVGFHQLAASLNKCPHCGVGLTAALKAATVEAFLMVLRSKLTQYDERLGKQEGKRGAPNIYRLGHFLKAAEAVEKAVRKYLKQDDAPAIKAFKDALGKEFDSNLPPIKNVIKQIDKWLDQGKLPSLKG